jgi:hypothetical protein
MDVEVLQAQRREAVAKLGMAKSAVETAQSTLAQRQSEKTAAEFAVAQREAELNLARQNFARSERMVGSGAVTREQFDTHHAAVRLADDTRAAALADALGRLDPAGEHAPSRPADHAGGADYPHCVLSQGILFRGAGLDAVWPQFVALALVGAILFGVALTRFRRTIGSMA